MHKLIFDDIKIGKKYVEIANIAFLS